LEIDAVKEITKILKTKRKEIIVQTTAGLAVIGITWLVSNLYRATPLSVVMAGAVAMWGWSAFIYVRKKSIPLPEKRRRIRLGHPPSPDYYSTKIRRLALIAMVIIPIVPLSIWGYSSYQKTLPPEKFTVLIADFSGPDLERYRVTETIFNRLRNSLKDYEDVSVESLGRSISEQEGSTIARSEGEKKKASVVIWGWYGVTQESAVVSINFEILCKLDCSPQLRSAVQGDVQLVAAEQLDSFTIQSQLSEEMALLSLLTVGLVEYSNENWNAAIASFTDALNQGQNQVSAKDVYYYRAQIYMRLDQYDLALSDLNQAIALDPNFAMAYNNLSVLYGVKGDLGLAISNIDRAIALDPENADYHNEKGTLYLAFGQYRESVPYYDQAILLDSTEPSYFKNRGIAYYWSNIQDLAFQDLNQSIKLYDRQGVPTDTSEAEDFARALVYRGTINRQLKHYSRALQDFNRAISLKPDYANAYHSRAAVYYDMRDRSHAIEDLNTAISLSTDPVRKQEMEKMLKDILSH
jgi:tetratricopeptide (TPR) repeat protein